MNRPVCRQVKVLAVLLVDNISITPLPMSCSELFMNGDAEDGDTGRFWRTAVIFKDATVDVVSLGGNDNNHALKVSNRQSVRDGLQQTVDARCLTNGSAWKLFARMKLVSAAGGSSVSCDPTETSRIATSCPPVRIVGSNCRAGTTMDELFYLTNVQEWKASTAAWKDYEVAFTVSSDLATCNQVEIGVRSYNVEWDLVVDDLSLSGASEGCKLKVGASDGAAESPLGRVLIDGLSDGTVVGLMLGDVVGASEGRAVAQFSLKVPLGSAMLSFS